MKSLWQHQDESLHSARSLYAKCFRSILIQGVTGTGKTRMVASAINNAISRHRPGQESIPESKREFQTVWFIVPRKELLWQSNQELNSWKIQNQVISGGGTQRNGFNVYIWSRDTLVRRLRAKQVFKFPDLIIFDEAHIAIDQQLEIKQAAPGGTIILGVTATPERLDGRPLLGMYDVMVEGPQMQWFVENKFLKRPYVLSIPPNMRITSEQDLKYNTAGDLTRDAQKKLDELYKARARGQRFIFGNEIEHYKKHAPGQSFLVFVRTLEQAEDIAQEFTENGIPCKRIDGTMADGKRKEIVTAYKNRRILGLTTVDLLTYGFDAPGASCMIDLAPTMSVAKQYQKWGRVLRWDDNNPIATILDHVGNCDEKNHGHPLLPRVWNFQGTERKDKKPKDAIERIEAVDKCPVCFDLMFDNGEGILVCRTCGATKEKPGAHVKQIDGYLVEIKEPTPLKERPPESQRYYQDMLNNNRDCWRHSWYEKEWTDDTGKKRTGGILDEEAVKNYVMAAKDLKWKNLPMQVYYKLAGSDDYVHTSLLKHIGKTLGYKPYWYVRKREELEERMENKRLENQSVDEFADNFIN